jgi:hypothetical protein
MYTGLKPQIPVGEDGMYGPRRVPITGLILARGITLENNQIEKEGGAQRQNVSALPGPIRGLWDWWPESATQRTVAVTIGGGIYLDDGVSWTFAITARPEGAINTGRPPYFVEGGQEVPGAPKKLFLYTGASPIQVGVGDFLTMAPLDPAKRPLDWVGARQPSVGIIHEGRHWAFLQHTAYYTPSSDHEDFVGTGAGSIPIGPGEGDEIVAAMSFRKMLVLWKRPNGVYVIDTSNPDPAAWRYDIQSRAVGTSGPWGVTPIPNDVAFIDTEGSVHALSATSVERDAESSDLTTPKLGTWIREHVDAEALGRATIVWYGDKSLAYALLPARGSVGQTVPAFQADAFQADAFGTQAAGPLAPYRLTLDFNNPAVGPRFCYSDRDEATCLTMRRHQGITRPYIGTTSGHVYRLDMPDRSKDGAGYIGEFQTDHTDLGEVVPEWRGRIKNFDYLEFWVEGLGEHTLYVDVWIDGILKTLTPLAFNVAATGVPLGVFVLDVDRLAEARIIHRRRRLLWRGTRISFRGYNSEAGASFKIIKAFIGAKVAE